MFIKGELEGDKNDNMDKNKRESKERSQKGYNKQKQILHNNKQQVPELIKPLHY